MIKQARIVHLAGGGDDPLAPKALDASAAPEEVRVLGLYKAMIPGEQRGRHDAPPACEGDGQDREPLALADGGPQLAAGASALVARDLSGEGSLLDEVVVKLNPLVDEPPAEPPADLVEVAEAP